MSTFGMTGAAQMLQAGARSQGRDLGLEDARNQLSATHQRNNAQIKPSDQGLRELNDYIAKHYPDGNVPRHLREAVTMAQSGGINDMGAAMRVQGDIGNRTRGTGAETNPLGAGARLANSAISPGPYVPISSTTRSWVSSSSSRVSGRPISLL